jgi:hypothetical protein
MYVDSDVVLSDRWFEKAWALVDDKVGAVWGIEIWSVLRNSPVLPIFERVTLQIFEERGGTHDLLVRTKAVAGIHIPFELHTYEDGYIKRWIEKNGTEWWACMTRTACITGLSRFGRLRNTSGLRSAT